MFDLEQSIADWRKQMLAAGIKTPVPLEELEIHLHDEIERQMKSGLNEQEAFNSAVQNIGQAQMIQNEFEKQTPKPLNWKACRSFAESFLNFGMMLAIGVSLMDAHDAVIRTFGLIILIASSIGLAAICIQTVVFYFGTREGQVKSGLKEQETLNSAIQKTGQIPKLSFSFSMADQKFRWSAPVKFIKVLLMGFMIFACLAWLANAGVLICALMGKIHPDGGRWSAFGIILFCWLAVLLVTTPMQLVSVFGVWRRLSKKSKDALNSAAAAS